MIVASAPGKLMLAGEYTVAMAGGVALAVAVDRRLHVQLDVDGRGWRVTSPELRISDASPEAVPVVAAVLKRMGGSSQGGRLHIASALGVGRDKPGLGSSSALCVAMCGALAAMRGRDGVPLEAAIEAHRESQGGAGSGYDVATCLLGGICLYSPLDSPPRAERVSWPPGLYAAPVFTGRGASTVALLSAVDRWRRSDLTVFRAFVQLMASAARGLVDRFLAGDVPAILDAAVEAQEALHAFGLAGHIGLEDEASAVLLAAIEEAGAIGRTAGAGGGDCVWALTDDPAVLADALASARAEGFQPLDVALGARGLMVETF